jgi:hypothetical protein
MSSTDETRQYFDGPVWAAIISACAGCAAFGLLVDLAEASKSISNALNFYNPTGDLSGKSTVAIITWLIFWIVLHVYWKNRDMKNSGKLTAIAVVLILLAMLAVFPPFFGLFAAG